MGWWRLVGLIFWWVTAGIKWQIGKRFFWGGGGGEGGGGWAWNYLAVSKIT